MHNISAIFASFYYKKKSSTCCFCGEYACSSFGCENSSNSQNFSNCLFKFKVAFELLYSGDIAIGLVALWGRYPRDDWLFTEEQFHELANCISLAKKREIRKN